MRKSTRERGATLVESAISMLLIITVVMAVAEFGMAFKDWLSVSHAAREGARAGATFANNSHADIEVLNNVEEALLTASSVQTQTVRIYNGGTNVGTTYTYAPTSSCRWTPCPDPDDGSYIVPAWDPGTRDVTAPTTDRIGVDISYDHTWFTGLFRSTSNFDVHVIFQIEPQLFS
jgi:Flp pilus assembly protein TadG